MSNSYTGARYTSDWKPSQSIHDSDIDFINRDAIEIITPEQVQTIPNEKSSNAWPQSAIADSVPTPSGNSGQKVTQGLNEDQDQILLESKSSNDNKRTAKSSINRRTSKLIWDASSTEDLILNAVTTQEPGINNQVKSDETGNSVNHRIVTNHNYEVTEPADVRELKPEANSLSNENEYSNKFVNNLSKYNIENDDSLNNYARSTRTLRYKKMLYPSPVPLIPFRYNTLNHLPVDSLLAVLLSNYGFYLHGFYGLPNNYKNLYGYSASNNIHNNKPFGSYKIYSDTDSSN
ncbi:probable cyclin-dependent serine/threonine-protein kinase DDB_G0292550 [Leguminivora glycinivorella]|uniref:probable cyclin-dependent serine/threonine-protein kinase DDB_G0292550 n=1 Tax=Leguminivora glycinivorella TaxID=1035111 RepID=UPI00200E40AC|nr:probable cyclin-dependent serine/threonine-protein kinase DDB_G0292550 [Leguminivora glycinivorella]